MIKLKAIKKVYKLEERKLNALKGISLDMRKAEFVCVLGPSGCGKTTLLNIIGGLDRYTSGDFIIDGKSTKNFTDEDWDTYRSTKVGFVFQSYNLISHQTVLENVETALVISGISKEERRKRAIDALVKVGLAEHLRKTPRQLSGGEMQRVAIARSIVNNPQMILADEPTGALDSENSIKIMDLLKEIAKDRLVITVTHNNELAENYATRIIKMKDGEVLSDSAPYKAPEEKESEHKTRRSFMPYSLAAKLSLKNLAGKKVRTVLTSIASSIAIVGIALVLACTNGLNAFIDKIQMDTMSSVPITVSAKATNYAPLIEGIFGYVTSSAKGERENPKTDNVFINHSLKNMKVDAVTNEISTHFLNYLKGLDAKKVRYDASKSVSKKIYKKIKAPIFANGTMKDIYVIEQNSGDWSCLPSDRGIVEEQYNLIAGKYPENYDELLLVVNKNSSISDTVLAKHLLDIYAVDENKTYYTYDEILNDPYVNEYNLVLNDDYYTEKADGTFAEGKKIELATYIHKYYRSDTTVETVESMLKSNELIKMIYDSGYTPYCYDSNPKEQDQTSIKLKIVGILKLNDDTQYGMLTSPIAYSQSLDDFVINQAYKSNIVKEQLKNQDKNLLSGVTIEDKGSYNDCLSTLGYAEMPTKIKFYPKTIKDKDYLVEFLNNYNKINGDNPDITYTDNVGAVIELVRIVVSGVSAILITLTSVSLIVSAIMIGIITYVSVIERTKEIGILRSVGARKKDVVRLFVTETGMIGFISGFCGLILTIITAIPLNVMMSNLTGVVGFVFLYWWNYIALVIGSALLTILAGLIPSLLASKKDPVKALRSE